MSLALLAAATVCLSATPTVQELGPLKIVIAGAPLSLKHEGQLKEVLEKIAEVGGLNVVIVGDLNEPARLHLTSVTAEEALEAVAKIYKLDIEREGKMWVVRKHAASAPPAAVVGASPGDMASVKEQVRAIKAQAKELAAQAKEHAEAAKEDAQAAKEEAQEELEAAKEAAEEAKQDALEAQQDADALEAEALGAAEAARAQAEKVRAQAEKVRAHAEKVRGLSMHDGSNRVTAGGDVRVEAGTTVDTAVAYGGDVIVEAGAHVTDDVVAFGGDVEIEPGATIGGDAVAFGGEVHKGEGATIRGQQVSFGGDEVGASIAKGAMKARHQARRDEGGFGGAVATFLLQFALLFGLGFLATMFIPNRMKQLETTVRQQPVRNGLVGLLALVALVPATVLLVVTLIGIPVAMVMWAAVLITTLLGVVAVANSVGVSLPSGRMHRTQALVLALGLLALLLVTRIPVVGPMVLFVATMVSLGAVVRTRFGQPPRGVPLPDTQGDALPRV